MDQSSRDLRVLHVTPYSGQAWAYGGIPRVVSAQTRGLAERGVQLTVLTTDAHSATSRLSPTGERHPGIDQVVLPNLSNRLAFQRQLFLPIGLASYLGTAVTQYQLGHLHACHNLPGALAGRRLFRAGIPYLVQPNGTAGRIERRRLAKLLFDRSFGRHTLNRASVVLAVSRIEQEQLQRLGVARQRIRLIANPLDLAELAQLPKPGTFRQRFNLGDQALVLYLGQLSPRKRVDIAVRALAELGSPQALLVIAGSDMGSGRQLRSLVSRLGIEARVLFTGTLKAQQRLAALVDADLVVYPTEHEIFGLVPLEALCCGTPVVVCNDCGCGEIIRQIGGGLLVPVADVTATAAAMSQILQHRDAWQEPVRAAAGAARERFGVATICGQLHELYDELASGRVSAS